MFNWRCDHGNGNCNLTWKNSRTSTGLKPMASALVQQCSNQLSYQDLYIGSRPICWVHPNPWKEWNTEWWCELRKYKFNWRHEWYLQLNLNFRSSHHHSLIHQFNWRYERYLQLNLYFRSSHHHSVFHRNNCQTCTTWASNITLTPSGNKLPIKETYWQ